MEKSTHKAIVMALLGVTSLTSICQAEKLPHEPFITPPTLPLPHDRCVSQGIALLVSLLAVCFGEHWSSRTIPTSCFRTR